MNNSSPSFSASPFFRFLRAEKHSFRGPSSLVALLSLLLSLSALAQYPAPGIPLSSGPALSVPPPDPAPELAISATSPDPDAPARPWYAFWRRDPAPDDVAPVFSEDTPADDAPVAPAEPSWLLSLLDGTKHLVHLSSLDFKLDALPAAIPFSPDDFSALYVVPSLGEDDSPVIVAVLRQHPGFALRLPAPRTLRARTADGSKLSLRWADVLSLRDPSAPARIPDSARASIPVSVAYPDPTVGPDFPPSSFPVAFLPIDTPDFSATVPTWLVHSLAIHPDRTVTLSTVYGDVITGVIPLKRFREFDGAALVTFDSPFAKRTPPRVANRYRLASGDVLVAVPDTSASSASPAAPASLRAAVAAADTAAPDAPVVLRPAFDLSASLSFVPSAIENVVALGTPLPPATRAWSRSAQATDEILVPAATFQMGCAAPNAPANESPSVRVSLDPYYLASTPVTVAQYAAFVADAGYRPAPEARSWDAPGFPQSPNDPVVAVSWRDAAAYCNWLSKKARLTPAYDIPSDSAKPVRLDVSADGYRLPLEAEWELAARDLGKPVSFPWGDGVAESNALAAANFFPVAAPRTYPFTSPVKAFPPNPLGFYDLAGNVAEWCQDAYAPDAYSAFYPIRNFAPLLNPDAPTYRVIRGGSFASPLTALRVTARAYGLELVGVPNGDPPLPRFGFRVARNAP